MVDPNDGTTNFAAGPADVRVSLALTLGRAVIVGVVYGPITDERYTAAGALVGGARPNGVGDVLLATHLVHRCAGTCADCATRSTTLRR